MEGFSAGAGGEVRVRTGRGWNALFVAPEPAWMLRQPHLCRVAIYTATRHLRLRISGLTLGRAMLSVVVVAFACLCLARASPPETRGLRNSVVNTYTSKDLGKILASIDERLQVLDTISAVQAKQARRLDVIQDKLDRMETTLSLRLERAQLAAERLEHRLHMLQTNVQASVKESSDKIEKTQTKIAEVAQNLTNQINTHTQLLQKVSGAYADTWRRGLLLESMVRDGMSLVNVTRRELANGLRALARGQREVRLTSADLEATFTKRFRENSYKVDMKMKEVIETQKRFIDSCQRVQLDDPTHVADVLDKLIDSLINKTASTFRELQNIQATLKNHDNKVIKLLSNRPTQTDISCKRLENVFRNASQTAFNEKELQQLTEKFIGLTNRADAALQRMEARLRDDTEEPVPASDVSAAADQLLLKLKGINEISTEDDWEDAEDSKFFDNMNDFMEEDQAILIHASGRNKHTTTESTPVKPHRRHLHKHPYDRGPV
ncbi:jg8832 [Pararge aegeria aegeria]|uniref:Jg8832 protein n=1 Tax=Pararge aegeria aegeria TaxID=348720 RepID=A0A8S4SHU9_9NEOP|nr:jg8832 [Pararge aegeria aegeria]